MYVTNNEVDHFEVHICREMTNYTYFCVSKRSVPVSGMGQNEQSDAIMPIRPDPQNYSTWWPSTTSQMRGGRFVGPCVCGGLLVEVVAHT
jgi:hypothetical protein